MGALGKTVAKLLAAAVMAAALLAAPAAEAAPKRKNQALVGQVNLNTATAEELMRLPGIGPAKAEKILELRARRPFKAPKEVVKVKGIGPKFLAAHGSFLKVDGETDLAWVDATPFPPLELDARSPAAGAANASAAGGGEVP